MRNVILMMGAAALFTGLAACARKDGAKTDDDSEVKIEIDAADSEDLDAVVNNAAGDAERDVNKIASTAVEMMNEDAPEADGTEKFFGKKAFTIVSKQTGMEEGDVTEHVREWGRLRAEVKDTKISMAGFTQATKQRAIYDGAKIATVDETTGAVTTSTNPLYDAIVARMKGKSGVDFGKEMMAQMGGRVTGEKGKFAGHDCQYWEIASANTKACITHWGGTLHTTTDMAGVSFEKTAVEVRMGDGGPNEAFSYDASKATEAPNLEDIMKKMNPG